MSQSIFENCQSLATLGWNNFFQQQLSLEEWELYQPVRVIQQHKSELLVLTEKAVFSIPSPLEGVTNYSRIAVGDWLLLDAQQSVHRVLERSSVFSRKAAGSKVHEQLIAANVDTLLIVCSLNNDFNLNRIERYLVLAHEARVEPVVVLTKADLCETSDVLSDYISQVQKLDSLLSVVSLNALDAAQIIQLAPWCKPGKTLALLGSSGVGKSTLVNTLLGEHAQMTGGIREDDSKGHHTTTSRSLHIIPPGDFIAGGMILDTPGMREFQLANSEEGIEETFNDIMALAQRCKFGDCSHDSEPGCAVQAAIEANLLPIRRLKNYQKLLREDALNSSTLAERRDKERKRDRFHQSVQKQSRRLKKR